MDRISHNSGGECVVLVHGTWGRGTLWTAPESVLSVALAGIVGRNRIFRFQWSARNSQAARLRASLDLADFFHGSELARFSKVHLIAHSHGGNIAVRASRAAAARIASITTINTPFLHYVERDRPLVGYLITALISPILYVLSGIAFFSYVPEIDLGGPQWLTIPLSLLLYVTGFLAAVMIPIYGFYILAELALLTPLDRMRRKVAALYDGFGTSFVPTLCLYDRRDEARLAITASLMASSGLLNLMKLRYVLCLTLFIAVVVLGAMYFRSLDPFGKDQMIWILSVSGFFAIVGASFIAPFFHPIATPLLTAFTLGTVAFRDTLFGRILIFSCPMDASAIGRVVDSTRTTWLLQWYMRHSDACHSAAVVDGATGWVKAHLDGRPGHLPSGHPRPAGGELPGKSVPGTNF
ncbi:MAG TPA: alpha/beta fold hydrolase [Allosphingosinicella sp.]